MRKKSIKHRHQLEGNDCGPACVQMICEYYGKKIKLKTIKNHLEISKLGVSIKDLRAFLEKVGFDSITAKMEIDDVYEIPLPAILYLNYGHFVVLEKITKTSTDTFFSIVDPNFGKLNLDIETFLSKWLTGNIGVGIAFEPNENFETQNVDENVTNFKNPIFNNILAVINKNKSKFLFTLLLTLLVLLSNWAMPYLLKDTIDKGIIEKDYGILLKLLSLQFIFAISYMFSQSISEILTTKISLDINIDLNKSYFNKILNLPISFHDKKFKSDLIEGLNDQARINSFISYNLIGLITTILNIVVFSLLLIAQSPKIFFVFVGFSVLSFIYTFIFFKKKKIIDYNLFSLESANRNNIYELIMGISEVKINSAEETRIENWINSENKLKKIKLKSLYLEFFMTDGNLFIAKIRDIILLGVSAYLVIEDKMTLGVMMMISYVLGQLSGPFDEMIKYSKNIQRVNLSYDRLSDIYLKEEEIDLNTEYDDLDIINHIRLQNVTFKYVKSSEDNILENINFSIPKNKMTAIVGESGSGKSTLLKLLLGFYYPTNGQLLIGNTDIKEVNIKDWRKKCGVIMQEGYIFSGSIIENVTLSTLRPDIEKFLISLKVAELYDKVQTLPMNYNTKIGEVGISLSGGEKQRLLIARAVYKDPEFIFFDEATSSLDTVNEKKIIDNLQSYLKNKTSIIIAHRLSTIKNVDQIVVLKKGKIVEIGNHLELLQNKKVYYNLIKNQLEMNT